MKTILMKRFTIYTFLFMLLGALPALQAQVTVSVTINDGEANTTCSDLLSAPDPIWRVDIEQEGWQTYPATAICYQNPPFEQYTATYNCVADIPAEVEVCFEVSENDGTLFEIGVGCALNPECVESICENFIIPAAGTTADYNLALPVGLSSGGFVDFTVAVSETFDSVNDLPCDAIDFGAIPLNDSVGTITQSIYGNTCATNINEPNPLDIGQFSNNYGVWFTFTTDDASQAIIIEGVSDPENTGDSIDLQIALYQSDDGTCNGNFIYLQQAGPPNSLDGTIRFYCPEPNTQYYVLVDGDFLTPTTPQGLFGLRISSESGVEGGDERCDAEDLGAVPEGGSVSTAAVQSNFCATAFNDPFSPNFPLQNSVWYRFEAPPSGHVTINGEVLGSLNFRMQIGVYRSFNGSCTGFFSHFASQYTEEDLGEVFEVSCLFPGEPYWLVVDGAGEQNRGLFTLEISDAGDITPVTQIDTTICAGESYQAGNSTYTVSGLYQDTIQLFAGCDSIVISDVNVLPPVEVTIDTLSPAIGEGAPNGIAAVYATGGAGNYTYLWCTGETGTEAENLPGGSDCCVTVTDDFGCEAIECFTVDFVNPVAPVFTTDTVPCFGEAGGAINLSVEEGRAPYQYSWQNADNSLNGAGTIAMAGDVAVIDGLPAGTYTVTVADAYTEAAFTVEIFQPEPLEVTLVALQDASCFGFCDGALEVAAAGGVGGYTYEWTGGLAPQAVVDNICAGDYTVTVRDANDCSATLPVAVKEPVEFIVTPAVEQPVSCLGGADGRVSVTTNGAPVAYLWDTGDTTPEVDSLPAGFYEVTVTNDDGCEGTATVQVTQPTEAVTAAIAEVSAISCADAADGQLEALPMGPGANFTYQWSNGSQEALAGALGPGNYTVTVTNENGCSAEAAYDLTAPPVLNAGWRAEDLTCLNEVNGGSIALDTVFGGTSPYEFSLDGVLYSGQSTFGGLFAGSYRVWVRDARGCELDTELSVAGPPALSVSLDGDTTIHLGDTFELIAQANSDNVTYQWTSSLGDSLAPDGRLLMHQPLATAVYRVSILDTVTFCTATDFISVNVVTDRRVFIPNAFSPNGDGFNDTFTIFGGEDVVQVVQFRIFSRNGALVFEEGGFIPNDTQVAWDGKLRGQDLNSGVYVYYAELEFLDGKTEVFSGEVVLLR